MNCPKCDSEVSIKKSKCDRCGQDLKLYKRVVMASNAFYNVGLTKAKVRDLTGAISALKKSLQLNKKNTNARNLLGLVYYEMGETVSALSEWVLSKHFQNKDNDADAYMSAVQSNPTKLEMINQAIKKYNSALLSAKQGSGDLAIIQLKKVCSLNPRFIRAHQLLALLYIQAGEKEKAKSSLLKVCKIDVNNTMALRYLSELGEKNTRQQEIVTSGKETTSDGTSFSPLSSSYKEDKPNVMAYFTLVLGVVIGICVVYFLIVPTIRKNIIKEQNNAQISNSEEMAALNAEVSTLEKEKESLQAKITELENEIKSIPQVDEFDKTIYDKLFDAAALFLANDKEGAALELVGVNKKDLESESAIKLYDLISSTTFEESSTNMYQEGHASYTNRKYDDAIKLFEDALALNPDNVDAMYFMGRSYHQLGDKETALTYYNKIVNDYSDSKRAVEAKARIREIG